VDFDTSSTMIRGVNRAPNFKVITKPTKLKPLIKQNIWGQAHSKIYLFVGLKKPHYKVKKKFFSYNKKVFFGKKKFFPIKKSFFR